MASSSQCVELYTGMASYQHFIYLWPGEKFQENIFLLKFAKNQDLNLIFMKT